MADQSERHPSTKSSDTVSKHKPENIEPGVDGTVADEDAEFVRNMGLVETLNSTTKADVATALESTGPIDSNIGFNTNSAEDELLSAMDGDEPVQRDDGNDLLATSNYPEGTTHPGPEDSADLFNSLAEDEATNTQVSDTQASSENEGVWVADEEIDKNSEPDQSSTDTDDYTVEQEHSTQEVGHSFEKYTEDIVQNFDQESPAEIASQSDLLAANFEPALADDEINPTLEFDGENLESSDSEVVVPAELPDTSTSTIQDFSDDLEDVSEPLQAGVAEPYGDVIDGSVYSNQGAESDDMYNVPGQYASGETRQEFPAAGSGASHKTSVDIGDQSFQSDASNAGDSVLSYDNMLEEGDDMRWVTIGMPILLVIVIIIMGGYVYSLQSQIDGIHALISSDEEDLFDDKQSNGSVLLNESTLAHVNARIDNLADSVEAIANRTTDRTGNGPSGAAERDGLGGVNKDLAILAKRVKDLEEKGSARPLVLRKASKTQTGGTAKPKISTQKTVKADETEKTGKTVGSVALKPPVMRNKSGIWAVNLMSVTEKVDAERQLKGFRDKGVAAVIQPKTISGKQWYRIQVTGFGSKRKAQDYAASVKAKLGLASAWVTR